MAEILAREQIETLNQPKKTSSLYPQITGSNRTTKREASTEQNKYGISKKQYEKLMQHSATLNEIGQRYETLMTESSHFLKEMNPAMFPTLPKPRTR